MDEEFANQTPPLSAEQIERDKLIAEELAECEERFGEIILAEDSWLDDSISYTRGLTAGIHPDSDLIVGVLCKQHLLIRSLQTELEAMKEANRWIPIGEKRPDANLEVELFGEFNSTWGGKRTYNGRGILPADCLIKRAEDGFMGVQIPITHWRHKRTDTPQ